MSKLEHLTAAERERLAALATDIGECIGTNRTTRKQWIGAHGNASWCARGFAAALNAARATVAERDATIAELRREVEELMESARMSCESPADNCQCAGCLYAAEVHGKDPTDD